MDAAFALWLGESLAEMGVNAQVTPTAEPLEPLPPPTSPTPAYVSGVYYLIRCGEIVYVGQSGNVYSRIAAHMARAPFEFDHFSIEPCSRADLLKREAAMIQKYQPVENRIYPAHGSTPHSVRGSNFAGE